VTDDPTVGTQANPIPLPVGVDLADSANGWAALLTTINDANSGTGTYVTLDLSACTMSSVTEFNPGTANTGIDKIVSLVLPDATTSIRAGSNASNATFKNFTELTSVSGENVATVGEYAFFECISLTTVDLPEAKTIGMNAFANCTTLTSLTLPKAETINMYAFNNCIALVEVNLPEAITIGQESFTNCTELTRVSSPKAETVMLQAFARLEKLTSVDLSAAINIGNAAFVGCTSLVSVDLPHAKNIDSGVFAFCTSLSTVNIPSATSIAGYAFQTTGGQHLTITLGDTVPTLGERLFYGVAAAKTVTVRVPSAATGYGTTPTNTTDGIWGNGFRGGGWSAGAMTDPGEVNANINLTIEEDNESRTQ
jgi:hypothetical protein